MKRIATRLMFAAAVVAAVTSVASAQAMKADVPFAFRLGNDMYPAGTYRVDVSNGYQFVKLSNMDTRRPANALVISTQDVPREWRSSETPIMAFECGLGRCQLTRVWLGYGNPALNLQRPTRTRDEIATLRVIHLSPVSE
jgi:hypothetical protein